MALVRLTEITLFEDGIFENGDIELNISERTLLFARKPKDCFGKPYTEFTFANGTMIAVRESPKEVAMRFEGKPLALMLSQLGGHEKAPMPEPKEEAPVPPIAAEKREPRNVQEVADMEFDTELGTNVRRM